MTRTHGRCAKGQRLIAKVPHGRRKTLTFIAALRCDGLTAPCLLDGPIDADSFLAWVEQFLVPSPLCQNSCRLDRIGGLGGMDIRQWPVTDERIRIG